MIGRIFVLATLAFASNASQAIEPNGNRNIQVIVDFNFITRASNHWASAGAFVDEGTIGHGTDEIFKGRVAKVTDSPQGQEGTFTWTFSKAYTPGGTFGSNITNGSWKITGGTGKYEGITGQGTVKGTFNGVTGQIHDEFVGTVVCPNC